MAICNKASKKQSHWTWTEYYNQRVLLCQSEEEEAVKTLPGWMGLTWRNQQAKFMELISYSKFSRYACAFLLSFSTQLLSLMYMSTLYKFNSGYLLLHIKWSKAIYLLQKAGGFNFRPCPKRKPKFFFPNNLIALDN